MSFISFSPVYLTDAKMNYVIIKECEDIIRMQLLMNTSKVYLSKENIEYLKNQSNIT